MILAHGGQTETMSPTLRRPATPECSTALRLAKLGTCLEDSGPALAKDLRRVAELSERLSTGRFHLAVLGQFKRGKSTLLNALLGEALLPTSVVPLTAVPTFLRWGKEAMIRVARANGTPPEQYLGNSTSEREAFLRKYVTEEENPRNRLEVTEVEVLLPSPLLGKGVVLIDTPGIGSTYRHNTEATLNFLPQCDAALFLVSADPPITEVEVAFLREVRERVPRLFFVLNKIDYLDAEERAETIGFLRKTLCEQVGIEEEDPIFAVSARQGLQARSTHDNGLWRDSGLGVLETHLVQFLVSDKAVALEEAVRHKALDVAESALMYFRLGIRSLDLPQEELAQRLADFDVSLNHAYQEQRVAQDLLAGDKRRAVEYLEDQAELLRKESRAFLKRALADSGAVADQGGVDETKAKEVLAAAIPEFFEKKLGTMVRQIDERVSGLLAPHQRRIDELVEQVRRTAANLFEIPYHSPDSTSAFAFKSQPYWVTHKWDASISPLPPNSLDWFLPRGLRKKRAEKRLSEMVESLVLHNVENLRWATLQNLNQSFARFSSSLDECLDETISATKGAIQAACEKRERQRDTVGEDMRRMEAKVAELEKIKSTLMRKECR